MASLLDRANALPDDMKTLIGSFAYGVISFYEGDECGDPRAFRIGGDVYTYESDTWYIDTWAFCDYGPDYGYWKPEIWTGCYDEYLRCLTEVQAGDKHWRGGKCTKVDIKDKEAIKLWQKNGRFY